MRARSGIVHKKRQKKVLNRTKGFQGGRRRLYRTAKSAVMKAEYWSYRDRKQRKRIFRRLWIVRINAMCRKHGMSYSVFMNKLKQKSISLNRKTLSEMAIHDHESFEKIIADIK